MQFPEPKLKQTAHFQRNGFRKVRYLNGLELKVDGDESQLYRYDGTVDSIPEHLISVLQEFGYKVKNKGELRRTWNVLTGYCRHLLVQQEDYSGRLSIPFYRSVSPELDIFNKGHEDMHAIQHLGLISAFGLIEKRLLSIGFHLNLGDFGTEDQANIAGIMRVVEEGYDPTVLIRHSPINGSYESMKQSRG
jgi:hypothetical protein